MTCTIKPSQVYPTKPVIDESEWRVVGFGIPKKEEYFVTADSFRYGKPYSLVLPGDAFSWNEPRIIVERRVVVNTGTIDSVWE